MDRLSGEVDPAKRRVKASEVYRWVAWKQERAADADALRRFISRFSGHAPTQEALAELVAFQLGPRQDSETGGWNTYFGPMVTWKNKDGMVSENPTRGKITPNIMDYWQRRAQEETNPILQARYPDLVWDFSKDQRKEA